MMHNHSTTPPSNVTNIRPLGKLAVNNDAYDLSSIILGANNLPINLGINSESLVTLNTHTHSAAEILRAEIPLWAKLLGARPIGTFEVIHPSMCFQPYELTALIHCIASAFNVHSMSKRQHRAICSIDDINNETLALLKGLGFTQLQIQIPQLESLTSPAFHERCQTINDYHFDFFGIQLTHSDCLDQLAPSIRSFVQQCHPDYIFIGLRSLNITLSSEDKQSARIIIDEGNQHHDNLCLGPESTSTLNGYTLQHLCSPQRYKQCIEDGRLPLHITKK